MKIISCTFLSLFRQKPKKYLLVIIHIALKWISFSFPCKHITYFLANARHFKDLFFRRFCDVLRTLSINTKTISFRAEHESLSKCNRLKALNKTGHLFWFTYDSNYCRVYEHKIELRTTALKDKNTTMKTIPEFNNRNFAKKILRTLGTIFITGGHRRCTEMHLKWQNCTLWCCWRYNNFQPNTKA